MARPKRALARTLDDAFEPVAGVDTVLVPSGYHRLEVGEGVPSGRALADALERVRALVRGLDAA